MHVTRSRCWRLPSTAIFFKRSCSNIVRDFEDIPTPRGLPIIGTKLAIMAAGSSKYMHEYVNKRHKDLGPIFREKLGPVDCIFVADPDSIRSIFSQEGKYPVHIIPQCWRVYNQKHNCTRGLFFMNGPEWLEHRRVMNNLLLKGDLTWKENAANIVIDDFIEKLKMDPSVVDNLDREIYVVFLEVLVSVLLGGDTYKDHKVDIHTLVSDLAETVQLVFETTMKLEMIKVEWAERLGLKKWKNFEKAMTEALDGARKILVELEGKCGQGDGLMRRMLNQNVSKEQVIAISTDLILAAADTTAYTMQWLLYFVSKNKHVQEKIRSEQKNSESSYVKNVLKETLRLRPVAPFITRILPKESHISGYRIPENSLLVMSIYSTGTNPKYFENPLEFLPERWERGNKSMVTKQASLPWAMGSRACVGRKLAEYELETMVGRLIQNFHIELETNKDIQMVMKMIAAPSEVVRVRLKKII